MSPVSPPVTPTSPISNDLSPTHNNRRDGRVENNGNGCPRPRTPIIRPTIPPLITSLHRHGHGNDHARRLSRELLLSSPLSGGELESQYMDAGRSKSVRPQQHVRLTLDLELARTGSRNNGSPMQGVMDTNESASLDNCLPPLSPVAAAAAIARGDSVDALLNSPILRRVLATPLRVSTDVSSFSPSSLSTPMREDEENMSEWMPVGPRRADHDRRTESYSGRSQVDAGPSVSEVMQAGVSDRLMTTQSSSGNRQSHFASSSLSSSSFPNNSKTAEPSRHRADVRICATRIIKRTTSRSPSRSSAARRASSSPPTQPPSEPQHPAHSNVRRPVLPARTYSSTSCMSSHSIRTNSDISFPSPLIPPRPQQQPHPLRGVITSLRSTLVPLISVTSGRPHPNFPTSLLQYHLLTHDDLDSLARWYHQTIDGGRERWMYPASIETPWVFSAPLRVRVPALGNENARIGEEGGEEERVVDGVDTELSVKRRRFGRFIGLRGCESPVVDENEESKEDGDDDEEGLVERMEKEWRRALERAEEEMRLREKVWRGRW